MTLDAMGTQTEIAQKMVEKEADYVMTLKGNHGLLHEDVQSYWEDEKLLQEADGYEVVEKGHGRIEQRCYWVTTVERRYYLSSLKADARMLIRRIHEPV